MVNPGERFTKYKRVQTPYVLEIVLYGKENGLRFVSGDIVERYEYLVTPYDRENVKTVLKGEESLENKRGRPIVLELSYDKKGRSLGPRNAVKHVVKREIEQKLKNLLGLGKDKSSSIELHSLPGHMSPGENDFNFSRFRVCVREPAEDMENGG